MSRAPDLQDRIPAADARARRARRKKVRLVGQANDSVRDAVDQALGRWTDATSERADPTEGGGRSGAPRPDERLAAIDDLLRDPLARAWIADAEVSPPPLDDNHMPGVIAALPRRKLLSTNPAGMGVPTRAIQVETTVSLFGVLARMLLWILGYFRYRALVLRDVLRRENTIRRRAHHFRTTLERLGPTFVKLGQQLSLRADILPYEYCEELSEMLDRVEPFPSEVAVQIIERNLGKKITDVFQVFDPTPIGSASLSCVYQALLPDGQKVAVKVLRPGIRHTIAADILGLSYLMSFAELISLVRAGMTANLRYELSTMLLEECDFRREARYTELFRKEAENGKQTYLGAPRVFPEVSTDEVLVTEFVTGIFLSEILGALDRQDEAVLAQIRARGIDPRKVASNLVMAFNWETLENNLFHADPHPGNIVVREDNSVAFIDFGSCGRFGSRLKRLWRQFHHHLANEDVVGMTEVAIAMLEPLPPVFLDSFKKEVEALYWDWLYAMKSDHAEWWEKASGVMWMKFIALSQRYDVPVNIDTLKGLRVTFLFDTIVFRLCRDLDLSHEYKLYHRRAGKRARKRVQKAWLRRVTQGPSTKDYLKLEETMHMATQLSSRVQRFLDTPHHSFTLRIDKAYYVVIKVLQVVAFGLILHGVALIGLNIYALIMGRTLSFWDTFFSVVSHPLYQIIPITITIVLIRKVLARLSDPDVRRRD
jgi:predicted unusual protein kinase regulating ubiquinone biosynthesis (AarF/ABC1/UbiB family)